MCLGLWTRAELAWVLLNPGPPLSTVSAFNYWTISSPYYLKISIVAIWANAFFFFSHLKIIASYLEKAEGSCQDEEMPETRRADKSDEPDRNKCAAWAAGRAISGAGGGLPACHWATCSRVKPLFPRIPADFCASCCEPLMTLKLSMFSLVEYFLLRDCIF